MALNTIQSINQPSGIMFSEPFPVKVTEGKHFLPKDHEKDLKFEC